MATREYSPDEIRNSLIKVSRKNFYEVSWNIRKQVALDFIENNTNVSLSGILDCIEDFEEQHLCRLEVVASDKDSAIGEQEFYTGNVDITRSSNASNRSNAETRLSRSRRYAEVASQSIIAYGYGHFDIIAELGAGYGINLFRLSELFTYSPRFIAAEISDAGRDLCSMLNEHKRKGNIEPLAFDHRAPDLSFAEGIQSLLVITCHSIEQVQALPAQFFPAIARAAPRVVGIHFEPFGFQVDGTTERAQRHLEFMKKQSFNENFHACLTSAEHDGHLRIRNVELEVLDHQYENPTSLAVWDNNTLD